VVKYKINLHSLRSSLEKLTKGSLFYPFLKLLQINFIFSDNVWILSIYVLTYDIYSHFRLIHISGLFTFHIYLHVSHLCFFHIFYTINHRLLMKYKNNLLLLFITDVLQLLNDTIITVNLTSKYRNKSSIYTPITHLDHNSPQQNGFVILLNL
jgi:hypothetical protein